MKRFISKLSGVKLLGLVALSGLLCSFYGFGGEGYTIRLDGKLLVEYYVPLKSPVPGFALQGSDAGKELSIYYSHCGQVGKNRSISVRDEQGKVIKEWKYADALTVHDPMVCKVGDILALQRQVGNSIQLVYSSKEMPAGKLLANVSLPMEGVVKNE